MNTRVALIRRVVGLTLNKFGARLGVGDGLVCNWELGKNEISPKRQEQICAEFGVNPTWLATGEGEMFTFPISEEWQKRLDDALSMSSRMSGRLYLLRKKLKLSREKFSARLGLRSGVSEWENGVRPIPKKRVRQICFEFGVRPEWLMEGKGAMFEPSRNKNALEKKLNAASKIAWDAINVLPKECQSVVLQVARQVLNEQFEEGEQEKSA